MRLHAVWMWMALALVASCHKGENETATSQGSGEGSSSIAVGSATASRGSGASSSPIVPSSGSAIAATRDVAPPAAAAWKVGDTVQVNSPKDKLYYEAQIVAVGDTYKVLYTYDDHVEDGVAKARLRHSEWSPKDGVEAQVGQTWKQGKVSARHPDGTYDIAFGDGEIKAIPPAQVRGLRQPKSSRHTASPSNASNAPCPGPGLTRRCGGVCVNIQEDNNNCGSCGNRCRAGYHCDGHMSCRDASGNL
jgi:hypothetical protein